MTSFQSWLTKPRATVRVDATVLWTTWIKVLRRPFRGKQTDLRPRIEVLDRLSLGGKKSLLLVAIEGRRLLVGVGESTAPSITTLNEIKRVASSLPSSRSIRTLRSRRMPR